MIVQMLSADKDRVDFRVSLRLKLGRKTETFVREFAVVGRPGESRDRRSVDLLAYSMEGMAKALHLFSQDGIFPAKYKTFKIIG